MILLTSVLGLEISTPIPLHRSSVYLRYIIEMEECRANLSAMSGAILAVVRRGLLILMDFHRVYVTRIYISHFYKHNLNNK